MRRRSPIHTICSTQRHDADTRDKSRSHGQVDGQVNRQHDSRELSRVRSFWLSTTPQQSPQAEHRAGHLG
eukprot:1736062-Prymnesium_polylepis.1